MVGGNVSGSSQRCAECKQKRKKCDLAEPACLRCVRSGIKCSGPNRPTLFVNQSQDTFPIETSSTALQRAYNTRSISTDRSQTIYELSYSRLQSMQAAWARLQIKSSLPDDAVLGRPVFMEPLYTSLLHEFRPNKAIYGGIFSADRAPTTEAKHCSSIATCIRELLPWGAQGVPVLDAAIFTLLAMYYGRLHGDRGLVEVARSSYTAALNHYHRRLDHLLSATTHDEQSQESLIRASIALQFFEHLDNVEIFDTGHQAHIDGALSLLHSVGPEALRGSPDLRQIVSSLKPVATYLAIFRRHPNFLCDPPWRVSSVDARRRTAREELFDIGLDVPNLLRIADKNMSDVHEGHLEPPQFVNISLHLLLEFGSLWATLEEWLSELTISPPGPLYWARSQPLVTMTASSDDECFPKQPNSLHQLSFAYGTYAGLLVQYWALQLELLMTMIDLRRAILAHSQSLYVRKMILDGLTNDTTTADEISQLIMEAQVYLDSCLEGFIRMQLPLKTVTKYFDRQDV